MEMRDNWMKDPELRAAYEALGPTFRREVEKAQQRRQDHSGIRAVTVTRRDNMRQAAARR